MDHVIAGLQIELIGRKGSEVRLARPRHRFRRFEQILGTKNGEPAFLKYRPSRHVPADQRDTRADGLGSFFQVLRNLLAAEIDPVRNGVLAEDIREALYFARRGREERQARASFK